MNKGARLPKITEWARGKPVGLVMMAQQLAVGVEACFEILRLIKAGERIEGVSWVPNVKEWLRLYRSHRGMQKRLIERFRGFGGIFKEGADFAELILFG